MDNLLYCSNLNFLILKNKYHTIPNALLILVIMASKLSQEDIAAKKADAAAKKTDAAITALVTSILSGHCTSKKFDELLAAIVKCGSSREDAIRKVLQHVEYVEGLVLGFPTGVGTVLAFAKLVEGGEESINDLFANSTSQPNHNSEFVREALALVKKFYTTVLPTINECITVATELSTVDPTTRFDMIASFVLDCVRQVKIPGMTVLGPYAGERAQTALTTWAKDGTHYISTRFVAEFVETAGHSAALPSDITATHLTVVNGYLRRVVPGAVGTPTNFVELTVTCEINEDGRVFAREGTWFPSAINIEAARAGVEKFLNMTK